MSVMRKWFPRRAVAIVPLALLSAAWTAHFANPDALDDMTRVAPGLPDGASVPTEALEGPASYSRPGALGLGVPRGRAGQVVAASSTNGIPSAALAAYQRAETVINAADKACNMDWQLLAAVGRVESDHGRYLGSTLGTDGISRPGIYGIALNGTNKTQAISDTDAGQYDRDKVWDRAVGPMQFIPSTWSVVGVDADGDGRRNPQNINDAALAAAAYLCSGPDDLATEAGRRAAVLRYNHSRSYVDLVLRIREAYLQGDYTAVPTHTASAVTFTPDYDYTPPRSNGSKKSGGKKSGGEMTGSGGGGGTSTGGSGGGSITDRDDGGSTPLPGADNEGGLLSGGGSDAPITKVEKQVSKTVEKVAEPLPAPAKEPVDQVLTLTQAITRCTAEGVSRLDLLAWNRCINSLVHEPRT